MNPKLGIIAKIDFVSSGMDGRISMIDTEDFTVSRYFGTFSYYKPLENVLHQQVLVCILDAVLFITINSTMLGIGRSLGTSVKMDSGHQVCRAPDALPFCLFRDTS